MSSVLKPQYSCEEYLALEREADYKSEYIAGEIFAMGGASPRHALISSNLVRAFGNRLTDTPCQAYAADLRIQAEARNRYYYPDVVIVCGRPEYTDDKRDTVANPVLIVEVLSPTTRNYDRGEKFVGYRRLASLREYILVDQDAWHVEQFVRTDEGWALSEVDGCEASLAVATFGFAIPLTEIYAKLELLDEAGG